MHTVFSDGQVWPTVRVDEAWREGLDAIAITDHIELHPHKKDVSADNNRPYELAARQAQTYGILLIRGGEITRPTPPGHFNAIFLEDVNALDVEDFYEVFRRAAEQKAFVFWNHPGWQGPERGRWGEAQTRLYERKQFQGIEVCNGATYYVEAHRYALEKGLTFLGNSDLHTPSPYTMRTATEHRTVTLVFARQRSVAGVQEALRAGRTAVWWQNRIIAPEPYLSELFAACVEVGPVYRRAGNSVWVQMRNHSELDIELVRAGADLSDIRKRRRATITLPADTIKVVKFTVPAKGDSASFPYTATNFLVGPEQPLTVELTIPTRPAPVPTTVPAGN